MTPKRPGPTVLVTRALEDAEPLAQAIRACGGLPVCIPAVRTQDVPMPVPIEESIGALTHLTALAFASRRGVEGWVRGLEAQKLTTPSHVQLFAVGPATAAKVAALMGRRPLCAEPHTAAGMAALLVRSLPAHARVLLPTALGAGGPLLQALQQARLKPMLLPLYATVAVPASPQAMTEASGVDYIIFTSPSCVRSWAAWGRPGSQARLLTMGPSTSRSVSQLGLKVCREAHPSSFAGLCALLKATL